MLNFIKRFSLVQTSISLATALSIAFLAWLAFPGRMSSLHVHWVSADDLDMGYFLLSAGIVLIALSASKLMIKFHWSSYPLAILASIILIISELLDLKTVFFMGLIFIPIVCFVAWFGAKATLSLLSSVAIIGMVMPFWYLAIKPLQTITVIVNTAIIEKIGITALIEGNFITLPTGIVHVAGGCSGLKYFLSALALAFISSAWNNRNLKWTIMSALVAAALAMIGNWIRVFILVLIGYHEGLDHPLMSDHDSLGWVVFACVMAPWFILDGRWIPFGKTSVKNPAANLNEQSRILSSALHFSLCLAIIFAPSYSLSHLVQQPEEADRIVLPDKLNNWNSLSSRGNQWTPDYEGYLYSYSKTYWFENQTLEVSLLGFDIHGEVEIAKTTQTLFDTEKWQPASDQKWSNDSIDIRIAIANQGSKSRVVYYWYNHMQSFTNSILGSKLAQLNAQLFHQLHTAELVTISMPCSISCRENPFPDDALLKFIGDLKSHIDKNKLETN